MSVTKRISTGNYNLSTTASSNVVVTTGTMHIYGNLYVQGNTTVVNVANISTADSTITLNSNVAAPFAGNSGIEVYRGGGVNYTPALYWNETVKAWQLATNIANPTTYSNISTASSGSGTIGVGTATHLPYYATSTDTVIDGGPNLTWNGANTLTITGNLSTTNLVVNGNYITASTANSGGTGLYFNNGSKAGELVSNTRALALSIIFG